MPTPLTADERERRFIQYISTLNKGQLAEVHLRRLNEVANFRKALMDLVNNLIEKRAEDLAAGMLMKFAPPRPKAAAMINRMPLADRKRILPVWVKQQSKALAARRAP